MQMITTHKGAEFDAAASVLAAKILYPEAVAVLLKSLNPNVKAFLSIHKDVFDFQTPDKIELEEVMRLIVVDTKGAHQGESEESRPPQQAHGPIHPGVAGAF